MKHERNNNAQKSLANTNNKYLIESTLGQSFSQRHRIIIHTYMVYKYHLIVCFEFYSDSTPRTRTLIEIDEIFSYLLHVVQHIIIIAYYSNIFMSAALVSRTNRLQLHTILYYLYYSNFFLPRPHTFSKSYRSRQPAVACS